ncbi:MAG TPA: sulfite oxidase [Intrasporangium sp.]|uniref:sulfite oxidase n=1 Tax=Intrasporangium sp. TaxID=1925024 RepID=UPI002B4613E2|nr:sulfite oxidase [Intrasporangium sp.]HKX68497.1 sulfite oxidase [Intrasporangium sp.]
MTSELDLEQAREQLVMINPQPYNAEAPPGALDSDITPTREHYVRSNFALPTHDGTLTVDGSVDRPLSLTSADLRALPAVERAVTLECAGNGRLDTRPLPTGEPWGGYAVSTAVWRGARLSDVLAEARPRADGVEVRFTGADSGTYHLTPVLPESGETLTFVRSLALTHAADPASDILIAYDMNGEPLGPDHGSPFRLIVPHWFAVASVKWLQSIDVLTQPFRGEFQTGHYVYEWPDRPHEPVTYMRVRARITDPAPAAVIPAGTCTVRGKAWSGTGPIAAVEVSLAGAGEWQPAEVDEPTGPHHWQTWTFQWEATPGRHSLRARATDAVGNVQPDVPPWNRLGYGNNAIEVQYVDVI